MCNCDHEGIDDARECDRYDACEAKRLHLVVRAREGRPPDREPVKQDTAKQACKRNECLRREDVNQMSVQVVWVFPGRDVNKGFGVGVCVLRWRTLTGTSQIEIDGSEALQRHRMRP